MKSVMVRSEVVLCRAAGSQPLIRTVWSVADDGVLICTQENFRLWAEQGIEPTAIKVPFGAVFKYDQQLFQQLNKVFQPGENHNTELEQLWLNAELYHVQIGERDGQK